MLEIPGVEGDKVRRYGKQFLEMVQRSQQRYNDMMMPEQDPIRQVVTYNNSDDEFGDGRTMEGIDDEVFSPEERSANFEAPREVQAFNTQCESVCSPKVRLCNANRARSVANPGAGVGCFAAGSAR
jgi:hypothetical protein